MLQARSLAANMTMCTNYPATGGPPSQQDCFTATAGALILYPQRLTTGESRLKARLRLSGWSMAGQQIGLRAYAYRKDAPIPGGFNETLTSSNRTVLHYAPGKGSGALFTLSPASTAGGASEGLQYEVFALRSDQLITNLSFTAWCSHDERNLEISCEHPPLWQGAQAKSLRPPAKQNQQQLGFTLYGHRCVDVTVVVQVRDVTRNTTAAYAPYDLKVEGDSGELSTDEIVLLVLGVLLFFAGVIVCFFGHR